VEADVSAAAHHRVTVAAHASLAGIWKKRASPHWHVFLAGCDS